MPTARATSDSSCVLLVTLDTTRRDYLGCYGDTRGITPNLDALAAEGLRFANAYSSAAATPMAHASILTGLNTYQHGLRVIAGSGGYRLRADVPTLATLLQCAGWKTAAFLSSFTVSEYYGLERGFDHWDNGLQGAASDVLKNDKKTQLATWDVDKHQRRSDVTTNQFIAWLDAPTTPFFAWVHYWDPHDAALTPPIEVMERFPPQSPKLDDRLRALYAAEVYFVDQQFGRLIEALKSKGLYERTVIAVIADHGEGLGDHEWWRHRLLFQEQVRVPFLLRLSSGPRGVEIAANVRCTDILPTLLDYLHQPAPTSIFGRSLRPLIESQPDEPRLVYADQLNKLDLNSNLVKQRPKDGLLYSIVDGDWKLIFNDEHPDAHLLFNLKNDPGERENLFTREPALAKELIGKLEALRPFQREPFAPVEDNMASQAQRALGALGYVGGGESASQPVETP